jgi:hypothetical protein
VKIRERMWTYALVTAVAVLIWYWAAAETRTQDSATFRLAFVPAPQIEQIVSPPGLDATVQMAGSQLAIKRARSLAAERPLRMTAGNELPTEGQHRIDLVELLESHDPLTDTGVRIVSADPASVQITIDDLVPVTAEIKADTPGVEPEGLAIDPPQAVVKLPSRLLDTVGGDLTVEAHVPQTRLDRLEPGVMNTVENVKLRLPGLLAGDRSVRIEPPKATVKFTVRSRIKETTLPTVRVQIAGPPEDHEEYVVQIEESTLVDVTIKADVDLIRQIERGEARVVALVHLSHDEKERGVASKPVTCFMALPRDESSSLEATIVEAAINGSNQLPVVRLRITERSASSPG